MSSAAQQLYKFVVSRDTDCRFLVGSAELGREIFECHRLVLASCSTVFEDMLLGPMAEKTFEFIIPDVAPAVFAQLLDFAYYGRISPVEMSEMDAIFKAADKYKVDGLRESCVDFECEKLSQCPDDLLAEQHLCKLEDVCIIGSIRPSKNPASRIDPRPLPHLPRCQPIPKDSSQTPPDIQCLCPLVLKIKILKMLHDLKQISCSQTAAGSSLQAKDSALNDEFHFLKKSSPTRRVSTNEPQAAPSATELSDITIGSTKPFPNNPSSIEVDHSTKTTSKKVFIPHANGANDVENNRCSNCTLYQQCMTILMVLIQAIILGNEDEAHNASEKTIGVVFGHYKILYDSTGHSYKTIMSKFLGPDVVHVMIEEPYIELYYQFKNLERLIHELLWKCSSLEEIHLITRVPPDDVQKQQKEWLNKLESRLNEGNVTLKVTFSKVIHDRQIRLSNGFVTQIGRGLHYFQPSKSDDDRNNFDNRSCLETYVTNLLLII